MKKKKQFLHYHEVEKLREGKHYCYGCNIYYPASAKFFHRSPASHRFWLVDRCKKCTNIYGTQRVHWGWGEWREGKTKDITVEYTLNSYWPSRYTEEDGTETESFSIFILKEEWEKEEGIK